MRKQIVRSKIASEVWLLQLDVTEYLRLGLVLSTGHATVTYSESISTATAICQVYSGTDATPSAMISGSATINGNVVQQKIIGGLVGNVYDIMWTIVTSVSAPYTPQTLVLHEYITIVPSSI